MPSRLAESWRVDRSTRSGAVLHRTSTIHRYTQRVGDITSLAVPTNLLAGSRRYAYGRFLLFDVLGELVWIALYGGLGYAFADQWETISDLAGNLTGALIGLLALVAGSALAYRARRRHVVAAAQSAPAPGS